MFFGEDDYWAYVALMKERCGCEGLRVWAYCLMPNHTHLIIVPGTEEGFRGIGEAHRRYTRRINFRHGWRGHLWQERFGSFVMDEPYLLNAARYVERNPVRAGLVGRAEEWPYSSAAAHVTGRPDRLAEPQWLTDLTAGWVCTWGEYLAEDDDPDLGGNLHRHESTGRPLGERPFVERLARLLGRGLLPGKPGRPRKKRKP